MENSGIDYKHYSFTKGELIRQTVTGVVYFFAMGMIFYQNILLSVVAAFAAVFYVREGRRIKCRQRQGDLLIQFREAMYALASSLSAGRSAEQAFVQSLSDLKVIYKEDSDIVVEWQLIVDRLRINETIEFALLEFAERADVEDIHNFVSVFVMAKRSGGDLLRIIRETNQMINEKIEIQKEIDVLVTQKKYEQQILSYIIPGMILFFTVTSPNFLEPMYTTLAGRLLMTGALGLYMLSAKIGKNIVSIEV